MDEFFRNSTKIIDETPNANESSEEDISSKYLLVFNTHLDAFDNKNKIIQLQQARKYIEKTLYQTVPDILKLQIEASQKNSKHMSFGSKKKLLEYRFINK